MYKLLFLLAFVFSLSASMVSAQVMAGPAPLPQQEIDISSIKEGLTLNTPEAHQAIIDKIYRQLQVQSKDEILNALAKDLSIDELQALYNLLIQTVDSDWTEEFAELVWQARSLKIKLDSPVLYGNPRINLIAVFPGERQFSMMLSDGTAWEVADHLSGDDEVDLIIIRDLLGQYTEVQQLNEAGAYTHQISALGFPEIRFNGYMMANKAVPLILDGKKLYWFGELHR